MDTDDTADSSIQAIHMEVFLPDNATFSLSEDNLFDEDILFEDSALTLDSLASLTDNFNSIIDLPVVTEEFVNDESIPYQTLFSFDESARPAASHTITKPQENCNEQATHKNIFHFDECGRPIASPTITKPQDAEPTNSNSNETDSNEQQLNEDSSSNIYQAEDIILPKKGNSQKVLTGKRQVCLPEWKVSQAKKAKLSGSAGVDANGKKIFQAKMNLGCSNCRFNCQKNATLPFRQTFFNEYWGLQDCNRRRDYLSKFIEIINAEGTAKRQRYRYFLNNSTQKVRVCENTFAATFGISRGAIATVLKKLKKGGSLIEQDFRGKHSNRPTRILPEVIEGIKKHIESQKTVPSHYCRQSSNKTYLESSESLAGLYKNYCEKKEEQNEQPGSEHTYRKIFYSNYNMAFHKPKKDLCDFCSVYNQLSDELKSQQAPQYELHLSNKKLSKELMANDKELAIQNQNICTACFDVEQTLTTPRAFNSKMYYLRKLNIYNFTIYELDTHQGSCYLWNETDGGKGADEICTCLWNFIHAKAQTGITDFKFYSDNCAAQNKNQFLYSMYTRAAKALKVNITHRYLEKGHTYNEGDSIHATIENSCKDVAVYSQDQWRKIIESAKKNAPFYTVCEMKYTDFYNFHELAKAQKWKQIAISNLREIIVNKEDETCVHIKYDFTEDSTEFSLATKKMIGSTFPLIKKSSKIPLKEDKRKDLMKMCDDGLVPEEHKSFFYELCN